MARDPYMELGVSRAASHEEIRKAFRKLAKQYHPDANPGDKAAEERFKKVSAAFDIVGDEDKRRKFDGGLLDADGNDTPRYAGNPFGGGGFSPQGADPEGIDLSDLFGEVFGRGQRGGGGGGFGFGGPAKGQDVRARIEIELEESIAGAKKRIAFSDGRSLDITIQPGTVDGRVLRLKGQGAPGRAGPGDALIEIVVKPHPVYRREGDVLVMELPISVPDAVLGGKVQTPTPDGPVTITIPKGANTGRVLRLKGRGMPDAKGGRGDLMARLVIALPDEIDAELEKFAEEWREKRPYRPKRR
ncbi:MAG: molecular chaperone DnaJ [Caulobacter sp.]|nr:molecular chaperone DnaJ [Caulobacter sp.]